MQDKIAEALNPPKPLRKARFGKISSIDPDSTGMNFNLKVLEEAKVVETKFGTFYEVLCGDSTGSVVVSLRDTQQAVATKDSVIILRNASAKMVAGHIRLAVDKWGKVEKSDEPMEGEVETAASKNISATEFELVASK